jgi:hypothetical protein
VRKFDTVHENETGYILLLASVVGNNHHASETGFFLISGEINRECDGFWRKAEDEHCRI